MVAPTKYRSVYTGEEIDQAIANMNNSLNASLIKNDFTGGTDRIASAELAKTLKTLVDSNDTPAHTKQQLLANSDTHVLTDAEYAVLADLSAAGAFKGSFSNAAARSAALSADYNNYTGNEISFIADDGSGNSLGEFSKWDATGNNWIKIQLYDEGGTVPQVIAAATTTNLFTYRTNRYSGMKCLVSVCNAGQTQRQIQEVMVTHVGTDTYISVYGEVGNATNLFNVSSSISGGIVTLIVTTLSTNLTLSGKKIAMV